jgi:hypothetical protein
MASWPVGHLFQAAMDIEPGKPAGEIIPEPVLPPVPPPEPEKELCQGGTFAKEGCVACTDTLYMTITGRDGQYPPDNYERWRSDHIRYGLPWAKERMLDFMKNQHLGVLDKNWKPDADPAIVVKKQKAKSWAAVESCSYFITFVFTMTAIISPIIAIAGSGNDFRDGGIASFLSAMIASHSFLIWRLIRNKGTW